MPPRELGLVGLPWSKQVNPTAIISTQQQCSSFTCGLLWPLGDGWWEVPWSMDGIRVRPNTQPALSLFTARPFTTGTKSHSYHFPPLPASCQNISLFPAPCLLHARTNKTASHSIHDHGDCRIHEELWTAHQFKPWLAGLQASLLELLESPNYTPIPPWIPALTLRGCLDVKKFGIWSL
jgi:hypothetical protein